MALVQLFGKTGKASQTTALIVAGSVKPAPAWTSGLWDRLSRIGFSLPSTAFLQ
jgi:hypothetical protein